ncbi:proline--tRNA ligase [Phenylobacterium sp. Root77]|jgi:prolyl-tRNA synthetase|uniref:proline--tRNA ligase n=1 Tax=unclassified Phenylobacterium TaxID=2640670 RepID=UPI00070165B2|nr:MULTISPECIES: proline--tRNA ligase [unclassified Phenylobacterium]KQW72913.1 proline--tRNA ligase [Phenylobacterium sp. Root1277]KQW92131.1 proline--tRNA ligase [Phenylobacterium sp. Root1290]KRC40362.1 proline--tRNA ligase [Phenylobacterium sp. Root77]
MQRALSVSRMTGNKSTFPDWYQAIVREADMAEVSPVRGSMIIKPWGYGVWERIQQTMDRRIKEMGVDNAYFPLFIPLGFFAKEAEHVDGFAKEMAVVTHHRLKNIDGKLQPDPDAKLEEPLIVRPTSETIIGDAFSRWVKSYRDLPLKINQWANVVRWEMRTRLFLRTSEFLWQEGHTAHADREDALKSTLLALEMYREFSENVLAMPVVAGEKPENERFPGADNTFSIEAMMQDGKALQAGTSHYLGTSFSRAQNIRYQSDSGEMEFCHTSSWGTSTRMIGGVIMTHGDDDGLRLPPAIAPRQIVIVPMLRGKEEDAQVLAYAEALVKDLNAQFALGEPIRALLDTKDQKSSDKRWNWVRRGAPVIVELGPRDAAGGQVSFMRRDRLRDGDKVKSQALARDEFVAQAPALLAEIQQTLFDEAKARLDANIRSDLTTFDQVAEYFGQLSDEDEETSPFKGWVRASWSRPTGDELEKVVTRLKALKLTLRNAPADQPASFGACVFTGAPGVEEILIGRSY